MRKIRTNGETEHQSLNLVTWLVAEIGEVIDVIKKKGSEKIMQDPAVRNEILEEIADCFIYLCDILHGYQVSAREFSKVYQQKMQFNLNRDYSKSKTKADKEKELKS